MTLVTLSEACSSIVDCAHKTAPVDPLGEYFAVGTPAMRGNVINYDDARRISQATFEAWTERMRPTHGDLLLAREAPVGPVVRLPRKANIAPGQRTVLLRPDPDRTDSGYLFYALTAPHTQARFLELTSGSTVHHLNVADVREFQIELPNLSEQVAIAEVLGALDDKIAANSKLTASSEALSVALASQATARTPLGQVATLSKAQALPSDVTDEVVHHYSLPAFDNGSTPEFAVPNTIKSSKFLLTQPAVLLSKLNPRIPRIWAVTSPDARSFASTEFLVLTSNGVSPAVLWSLLKQPSFTQDLESRVAGTTGSHQRVRPADALATQIGDPASLSAPVQASITFLVDSARAARDESRTLAETRDALLPHLMSGRLSVQDAEKKVEDLV